jgi:hypothetical protein
MKKSCLVNAPRPACLLNHFMPLEIMGIPFDKSDLHVNSCYIQLKRNISSNIQERLQRTTGWLNEKQTIVYKRSSQRGDVSTKNLKVDHK